MSDECRDAAPWVVPPELRALADLAARYGSTDDGERTEAVERASTAQLRGLVSAVDATSASAWEDLVRAQGADDDPDYLRYSALLMAYDLAKTVLRQRSST